MDASDTPRAETPTLTVIRRVLLAILMLGMLGTGVELVLLEHYESASQFIPLVLLAMGLVVVVWHAGTGSRSSARGLRITMVLFLVAGIVGVALHYRGSLEFQMELDAAQHGWPLFMNVMRAKAPPALAPGVMAHLGLIGIAWDFRHPASRQ